MNTVGGFAMYALLLVPGMAALNFTLRADYSRKARWNIGASAASLVAALLLLQWRPAGNVYLRVDDFNIYLILLNNFVSFTTSIFSAARTDGRDTPNASASRRSGGSLLPTGYSPDTMRASNTAKICSLIF